MLRADTTSLSCCLFLAFFIPGQVHVHSSPVTKQKGPLELSCIHNRDTTFNVSFVTLDWWIRTFSRTRFLTNHSLVRITSPSHRALCYAVTLFLSVSLVASLTQYSLSPSYDNFYLFFFRFRSSRILQHFTTLHHIFFAVFLFLSVRYIGVSNLHNLIPSNWSFLTPQAQRQTCTKSVLPFFFANAHTVISVSDVPLVSHIRTQKREVRIREE